MNRTDDFDFDFVSLQMLDAGVPSAFIFATALAFGLPPDLLDKSEAVVSIRACFGLHTTTSQSKGFVRC